MEGSAGGQRLAESKYQASAEIGTNKETGLHKGDRTKNNETCRYQTHSIATSRLTWPARMKGEHTQFSAGLGTLIFLIRITIVRAYIGRFVGTSTCMNTDSTILCLLYLGFQPCAYSR